MINKSHKRVNCPCCGYPTLDERGAFDICILCDWEDDGQDDYNADAVLGGPNRDYSLTEARANFKRHLIMYREYKKYPQKTKDKEIEYKKRLIEIYEDILNNAFDKQIQKLWELVDKYENLLIDLKRYYILATVQEIYSKSKLYKAEIYQRDDGLFHVDQYKWDNEWEAWLPISRDFSITDTRERATNIALEKLRNCSGEEMGEIVWSQNKGSSVAHEDYHGRYIKERTFRLDLFFGILGAIAGILYWALLLIKSPEQDVIVANLFWGIVPALLSIISIYLKKPYLMFGSFIITLPLGIYLLAANNYFVLFGSMPVLYLIAFILILNRSKE